MMSKISLPNLMRNRGMDDVQALTMLGNEFEFEFEWYEPAVPAAGKVYLKIISPVNKFTLVNFREVRFDQTRGVYRVYSLFSGGVFSRTLPIVKMRSDSPIPSGATVQVVTGPTVSPANAFSTIPLWGAEGVGNRPQGGGLSQQGSFRIIPPGATTLLEFENLSTNPAQWYAYFKQFEISPGAMPQLAGV